MKMSLTEVRSNLFELNCCKELMDYEPFWCYRGNSRLGISNSSSDCDSYMFIELDYDFEREKILSVTFAIKAYSKKAMEENYVFNNKEERINIIKAIKRFFPMSINYMSILTN